jgi:hypothetical protein
MTHNRLPSLLQVSICLVLLFCLAACSPITAQAPSATQTPTAAQASAATPTPTQDTGGLTADEFATLSSLEKLDDYPFYVMHYTGDYRSTGTVTRLPTGSDISCSLFASLSADSDMIYGRNFDWDFSPSLLLFTNPPDGYASVSMVGLTFIGVSSGAAQSLAHLPINQRTALLSAPSMPFDGMNEYGLTIGMAAVPDEFMDDGSYDPALPMISSISIIRLMLDHARNVDEAIQLFEQYNLSFSGGPPIHYLLADRSGKAVLVEFYQGKMILLPNEAAYHLATNHLRCIAQGDGGCWRYHILSAELTESNGELDEGSAMQLLSDVRQEYTQWSSLYDMTSGDIRIAVGQNYSTSYTFHLDLAQP